MGERVLNGRCLCGAVHFTVPDEFEYAAYCHCSACRRRSGSAFTAFGGIALTKITVVRGHESVLLSSEDPEGYNCFCGKCYSPLFAAVRDRQYAHVQLGSLTETPSLRPTHHIYVGSKSDWHDITDDLPQHHELPPGAK